jgi:hypothetical protein
MKTGWYPFAIARDGTLSYLAVRDLPDGGGSSSARTPTATAPNRPPLR